MAHLKNLRNEYELALGRMFDETPKAVLAAIAVSFATTGGDHLADAQALVAKEWQTLVDNGIIPQKLTKTAKEALSRMPADDEPDGVTYVPGFGNIQP